MKTLFNADDCARLSERFDRLRPDAAPRWGRMDCAGMLAHVADGVRMAIGELPTKSKRGPLRFRPVHYAIIYWLPFPKGAPTAPELIARRANDCSVEVAEIKSLIDRFTARAGTANWPEHPAFGPLSERDWGVLVHKHIDHHLRQFGA